MQASKSGPGRFWKEPKEAISSRWSCHNMGWSKPKSAKLASSVEDNWLILFREVVVVSTKALYWKGLLL